MGAISIGGNTPKKIYFGTSPVKTIYCGTTLVWSAEVVYTKFKTGVALTNVAQNIYKQWTANDPCDVKIVKMKPGTYDLYASFTGLGNTSGYTLYMQQTGSSSFEEIVSYQSITSVLSGYNPYQALVQCVLVNAPSASVKIYYSNTGELYKWDFDDSFMGILSDAQYMIEEEFFNNGGFNYIAFHYSAKDDALEYRVAREELSAYEWNTWSNTVALGQFYTDAGNCIMEAAEMYRHSYVLCFPSTTSGTGAVWNFYSRAQS